MDSRCCYDFILSLGQVMTFKIDHSLALVLNLFLSNNSSSFLPSGFQVLTGHFERLAHFLVLEADSDRGFWLALFRYGRSVVVECFRLAHSFL